MAHHIKAAFGGDLLPFFGDQGHHVGLDRERNRHHFARGGHLQIQPCAHGLAQQLNVAILNVTPVFTQMHRDAIGAAQFGE